MINMRKLFNKVEKLFENFAKKSDDLFDQMHKDFEEVEDQLDESAHDLDQALKDTKPGEEKEVVTEEKRPDGTVIITRTVVRKIS